MSPAAAADGRSTRSVHSSPADGEERWLVVGRISGLYGVRGWVKVYSWTEPREQIVHYTPWTLVGGDGQPLTCAVVDGRQHGKGVVARLEGVEERDQAAALLGREITIPRSMLPEPDDGSHYWSDLIGLRVVNRQGVEFGRVDYLFETGANDVIVVKGRRERLLPYIAQVIVAVDLQRGVIDVDWDEDF